MFKAQIIKWKFYDLSRLPGSLFLLLLYKYPKNLFGFAKAVSITYIRHN